MTRDPQLVRISQEAERVSRSLGQPAPSPYMPMTLEDLAWMDGLYDFGADAADASALDKPRSQPRESLSSDWGPGSEDEQLSLF